ncbi:MAG: hypothetical protein Q7J29_13405 [Stagnimonas sp.]|nr:hypothetical protein [Stagnimonas sp.]
MRALTIIVLLAALTACGKQPEVPKPGEPQGRAETQPIRNTEALGYDGKAIADKVDGALDANDQRKAELDSAIDAQTNPR